MHPDFYHLQHADHVALGDKMLWRIWAGKVGDGYIIEERIGTAEVGEMMADFCTALNTAHWKRLKPTFHDMTGGVFS
jgi:hypothetical protein